MAHTLLDTRQYNGAETATTSLEKLQLKMRHKSGGSSTFFLLVFKGRLSVPGDPARGAGTRDVPEVTLQWRCCCTEQAQAGAPRQRDQLQLSPQISLVLYLFSQLWKKYFFLLENFAKCGPQPLAKLPLMQGQRRNLYTHCS